MAIATASYVAGDEQFRCDHLKPLIICRGPIRKEAMDVFSTERRYGILLSEKDSGYRGALRLSSECDGSDRVHRVPDHNGAGKRRQRIADIISISHTTLQLRFLPGTARSRRRADGGLDERAGRIHRTAPER